MTASGGDEMIKGDQWHKIHTWHRLHESKKSIARAMGLDVRTVRKILSQKEPVAYTRTNVMEQHPEPLEGAHSAEGRRRRVLRAIHVRRASGMGIRRLRSGEAVCPASPAGSQPGATMRFERRRAARDRQTGDSAGRSWTGSVSGPTCSS
jgi:hypothetical protein